MAEIAPAGGGPNRLFLVLAIGLAALLVLGLLAVGGVVLIPRLFGGAPAPTVRAVTTPTRLIVLATAAPTSTAEPTEAATPTLVISGGAVSTAAPTVIGGGGGTPTEATPGAGGELPETGLGEDLLLLSGGLVFVLIIFAARRLRSSST